MKRAKVLCCERGCDETRFCYGRCYRHFKTLDPAVMERLRGLPKTEREIEYAATRSNRPSWTYEGQEDLLPQYDRESEN